MFHLDHGLVLTRAGLAIDSRRSRGAAFVSHAHLDHMARHALAICTPVTAALYQLRLGRRKVVELPYGQRREWGGLRLTTFSSGHCLGGAMLLAEDGAASLLYTGDFKLTPSATAPPAELPRADFLVMESTFGRPIYRFPPRDEVVQRLVHAVREALAAGRTVVVQAYSLGKAQEVTRILTHHDITVWHHPEVFAVSQVYEQHGMPLGDFRLYKPGETPTVVITPPRSRCPLPAKLTRGAVQIVVTGWAIDRDARRWREVDHAIPLSDHADFDELLEAVRQVRPRKVYCTHGPPEFVATLREQGWDAQPLEGGAQP